MADKAQVIETLRKILTDLWNTPISFTEIQDELFLLEMGSRPNNKVLSSTIKKLLDKT